MNRGIWILALILAVSVPPISAGAAERIEEATVIGKDRSGQAGQVPTDTRSIQAESKMKKEAAPSGLKTDAPGVRAPEKMEKPRMSEPEREKPEQKKGLGNIPVWMLILLVGIIAAAG